MFVKHFLRLVCGNMCPRNGSDVFQKAALGEVEREVRDGGYSQSALE